MIYKIEPIKDDLIQSAYEEGMKVFGDFWGINWVINKPNILMFGSRKEIDDYKGTKTEPWVVGWANNGIIHLLGFDKLGIESAKKYTVEKYSSLVKHELGHLFYKSKSGGKDTPRWLNEGLSIYLSGQIKTQGKPEKLVNFLDFYSEGGARVYDESGFVIELLINMYGKEKIIELVKLLGTIKNEDDLKEKFMDVYGFELSYKKMNELYLK